MDKRSPETLMMKLPSVPESVTELTDRISAMLERLRLPEDAAFDVKLACQEAIVNAVEHGNQCDETKLVRVHCRVEGDTITVTVRDEGEGFDPCEVADPTAPQNILRENGRGIFLIRSLADEVHFNEKGNEITIVKRLPPAEPAH
ncbi:MAG: ATP-binding protein [Planctomycetota bacterium]